MDRAQASADDTGGTERSPTNLQADGPGMPSSRLSTRPAVTSIRSKISPPSELNFRKLTASWHAKTGPSLLVANPGSGRRAVCPLVKVHAALILVTNKLHAMDATVTGPARDLKRQLPAIRR